MKTTLALVVVTCCVLRAAVARPRRLFACPGCAQPRPDGLIAGWLAEVEEGPSLESTYPYAHPRDVHQDMFAGWPADTEETPRAHPESARRRPVEEAEQKSHKIMKAYEQEEEDGDPDYIFAPVDEDGNIGLCGCWYVAAADPKLGKGRIMPNFDFHDLSALLQEVEVLPFTFYDLDGYGILHKCKCYLTDS